MGEKFLLEMKGISKRFGGVRALDKVDFHLREGTVHALMGENGAGKSTLVKLISGLYLPTKGTVYVNGIDTRELDREAYYRHESAVFQDTFTLAYSVAENVALNEQWDEEKVWECLEKSGLSQKVTALPQGLSANLGNKSGWCAPFRWRDAEAAFGKGIISRSVHNPAGRTDGSIRRTGGVRNL